MTAAATPSLFSKMLNRVTHGDCVNVMKEMPSRSVDLIVTDPPYLVRYLDRSGRSVKNDDNDRWLDPAFAEMSRVLKPGKFCVSFYAWNKIERFAQAWNKAGLRIAGHIVFPKKYASSSRFMKYQHEQAYLLVKGYGVLPSNPSPDVIPWTYTGNKLHPTQKPVGIFTPLIETFTKPGDIVLDPFCGSGSTLVAAQEMGRRFVGIELDPVHHLTASTRLQDQKAITIQPVSKFGKPPEIRVTVPPVPQFQKARSFTPRALTL